MPPKRKKSKPNPEQHVEQCAGSEAHQSTQNTQQEGNEADAEPAPGPTDTSTATHLNHASSKSASAPHRSSWYGPWRSKASPVAQVAEESISVTQGVTESSESARPPNSVSKSVRGSRKSIPLAAEASKVHATSDASDKSRPRFPSEEKLRGMDGTPGRSESKVTLEDARLPPEPDPAVDGAEERKGVESARWLGWWTRPDGYGSDGEKKSKKHTLETEEASNTPLPGTPTADLTDPMQKNARELEGVGGTDTAKQQAQPSSRSWFGLWSSAQNQQAVEEQNKDASQNMPVPEITISSEIPEEAVKKVKPKKDDSRDDTDDRPKSSGWAFWSSERSKDPAPTPGGTQRQVGELAVAHTPSQSHPEAAQFNEQREDEQKAKPESKRSGSLLKPKRGRPGTSPDASGESSAAPTPAVSQTPTPSGTPPREDSQAPSQKGKAIRPNLILPSFHATFPRSPNPGYIERLTQYLAQSLHIPGSQSDSRSSHVCISSTPPKIKKAVALGVHGFFPAPLIQKLLGQPTGTSIRFANYAATSIKTWCQEHQPDIKDVEVEKVALEGEGYIADRVNTLWKLLLNWLGHLRSADFILVACHSQGVPVAVMLVAKLIQLGCLGPNVRVGVCSMAGINLGPFLEYRSRLFGGSALELFDFCDSESKVSMAYAESLDVCLRHGVRVTFVGSIDDQLVSLESSLHTPLSHPYVCRAVFIDGRLHAPNFLTHLVVFALKLRNLGINDHALIRELSAPLAGSLVGGEGHSRVYDDSAVYRLAIDFALESTDVRPPPYPPRSLQTDRDKAREAASATRRVSLSSIPSSPSLANSMRRGSLSASSGIAPTIANYEPPATSSNPANPFVLPWAVRGMLEEPIVKRDMRAELEELVREFEAWRPTSKVLKDVRWRLEGVRSML